MTALDNKKLVLTKLGVASLSLFFVYVIVAFYVSYFLIPSPEKKYQIQQGHVIVSTATNPYELSNEKNTATHLPDWFSAKKSQSTSLWYQLPLDVSNQKQHKLAIYIENISQNAEVFINNKWLGNGGSMHGQLTRNRNQTLLFEFDSTALANRAQNILAIHIVGDLSKNTYLGNVYVGPSQLLIQYAHMQNNLRVDLVKVITFAMLLTSIFFSILWLYRQNDPHYLFYAIFTILWTFHDSNHFLRDIPLSIIIWETLAPLSFGFAMLCVVFFIHRYTNEYRPKSEKYAFLYVLLFSLPYLYHDLAWVNFYAYWVWSPAVALLGTYALFFIYKQYKKTQNQQLIALFISGSAIMIFGMHDLLLSTHIIPKQSPYMIHFAVLLVIIVISTNLINRFVSSMNVVENYNQVLETQVKLKTEEMKQNYGMLQQLSKKYTVAEERQRIMRDIHDGIGGQLVATLASIESGNVNPQALSTNLKSALQDLRLVIDSLDHEAEDLPTLLGMLRMRLSEQLSNASLDFHWEVEDLPRIDHFGPTNVLHTMRIIQEAITNALKHSHANHLTVSTKKLRKGDGLTYALITVSDDGIGTDINTASGRGLLNMKKRANLINADINFETDINKGMTISLEIPVLQTLKNT